MGKHHSDAKVYDPQSSFASGSSRGFPLPADLREKSLSRRTLLSQQFVATISVIINPCGGNENLRLSTSAIRFGGRVRQSSSSLRAALQHFLLKLLRPATGNVLSRQ